MIDHVCIPVSDLTLSRAFYEKAFSPLGFRLSFGEEGKFWAFDLAGRGLFEIYQHEGAFTDIHVAFRVGEEGLVRAFYEAALAAGARDNGAPGLRPQYTPTYYACFVFDRDRHNIEAVYG